MKPCNHQGYENATIGEYKPTMCRVCWHWLNSPEKRQLCEQGAPSTVAIPVSELKKKTLIPGQPEPKLPNALKRARNYLVEITKWIALGKPLVDETTYQQRRAACDGCPRRNKQLDACSLCGCPLHPTVLGDKLRMATARCADEPPRWLATVEEK